MPSVGATHSQQQIVLACQVGGDVAFSLASIFSANQNIHQSVDPAPIQPEVRGNADKDVFCRIPLSVDHNVSAFLELFDSTLCLIFSDCGIGSEFRNWSGAI
jgi:hypothetical protein